MPLPAYSTTPGDNTEINSIDIGENCAPGGINNAIRQLMADIMTATPFAHVYGSADQHPLNATATKIIYNTEAADVGSYYDTSSQRYTPPAGTYLAVQQIYTTATGGTQTGVASYIYKNGVAERILTLLNPNATINNFVHVSTVIADGDDYFEGYVVCTRGDLGQTTVEHGSGGATFLQFTRIGP